MSGPLNGIRVIDITTVLLGPYATQLLGDMGADVIKVEAPPKGDSTRYLGKGRSPGMGGAFLNTNRNKRSIALNLKDEAAKKTLSDLIKSADVLVHNMRPAAIARLGFSYDDVVKIKPDIVYCGAYGYSQKGSKKDLPAYDDLIQAASGLADLFREPTGEARYAPTVVADKVTGLMVSQAVAMALVHKERTGEGQFVEVPMYETLVSFLMAEHIYDRAFDPPLGDFGYKRLTTPLRRPHKSKNGYIAILPYTDKQYAAFFELADLQHLAGDPRFRDHTSRTEFVHEIYQIVADAALEKTNDEWVELCQAAQIPVAPVQSLDDVFNDPHMAEVGMFPEFDHPSEGKIVLSGVPVTFSKSPGAIRRMAPKIGEQGSEILTEIGYDDDRIAALRDTGALIETTD